MNIDTLAAALLAAKQKIADAQNEYDTALAEWLAVAPSKSEGAVLSVGDGYRITTTYGVNRTVDAAALDAIRPQIPAALFEQAITYKPALVLAGVRFLMNNEPDTWAVLAQAVTAKPSKPAVKVEPLEAMKEVA